MNNDTYRILNVVDNTFDGALEKLEQEVNEKIHDGWITEGQLVIGNFLPSAHLFYACQAVIRK